MARHGSITQNSVTVIQIKNKKRLKDFQQGRIYNTPIKLTKIVKIDLRVIMNGGTCSGGGWPETGPFHAVAAAALGSHQCFTQERLKPFLSDLGIMLPTAPRSPPRSATHLQLKIEPRARRAHKRKSLCLSHCQIYQSSLIEVRARLTGTETSPVTCQHTDKVMKECDTGGGVSKKYDREK